MADCPCVHSDDELDASCDSDSGEEEHHPDGGGLLSGVRDLFGDAAGWLHNTKENIIAKSRQAMFTGMQDLMDAYANSDYLHEEADPFPVEKLSGGPRRGEKVIVVGGGPGGVLMAMKLVRLGHSVTIIEKSAAVGGKVVSKSHRGTVHEMGACYLSKDYQNVVDLLAEFNLDQQWEIKRREVWSSKKPDKGVTFRAWFYSAAKLANNEPDVSDGHIALEIFAQALRYIHHHRRLLKNYNDTGFLPPRPGAEQLAELSTTIERFLDEHDMRTLKPLFLLAYTLQGYGFLDEESILYGMLWVTPTLLSALVEQLKVRKVLRKKRLRRQATLRGTPSGVSTLQNGYQRLFETIVDRLEIPVVNHAHITGIQRHDDGVTVRFYREPQRGVCEDARTEKAGFLVFSAPLPQALHLLDVRDDERAAFSGLRESTFITTLMDYQPSKQSHQAAIDSYFENIDLERPMSVWTTRDTHQVMRENGQCPHLEHKGLGTLVAYQYTSRSVHDIEGLSQAETEKKVQEEKEDALVELTKHMNVFGKRVEGAEQFRHRYFPRHNPSRMSTGVLWDIMELQGKYRTWYTGSTVCFEAINAILGYNDQLLKVWDRQTKKEAFDTARNGGVSAESGADAGTSTSDGTRPGHVEESSKM